MKATIVFLAIMIFGTIFNISHASSRNGNVISIDFQPDLRFFQDSDTIKIDVNEDSTFDIAFYIHYRSGGDETYAKPLTNECNISFISYLKNDSLKSDSIYWFSSTNIFFAENNKTEKIGIRIIKEDLVYYGWIKVYYEYIGWYKALYVDKYAFCTIPNCPFLWGQTEIKTGKKDYTKVSNLIECSNPATRLLQVTLKEQMPGTFELFNLQGKLVVQKVLIPAQNNIYLPQNCIYIYKFTNENGKIQTGKIEVK